MGSRAQGFDRQQEALAAAGQVLRALLALVLWIYLSSMTVLVGGEFNAELAHRRPSEGTEKPNSASGGR